MTSFLPPQIASLVSQASKKRLRGYRVTPDYAETYVQSTPEFFNEIVSDYLALCHAEYGFYSPEHGDWVYPAKGLKGGVQSNKDRMSPLNSWVLKSPVDLVPSYDQIVEEREWRLELVKASSSTPIVLLTLDQLHEDYVTRTCEQVIDHLKLLGIWADAGRPREQQDCFTGMDRKGVKKVLGLQRLNELDAKEKLAIFKKYHAPSFMVDELRASLAREQSICDQLNESMRYC